MHILTVFFCADFIITGRMSAGNNGPPRGQQGETGGENIQIVGEEVQRTGRNDPPEFHLNPAGAMVGILDFKLVECRKYYHKATQKLDSEELFDCSPENMHHFLKLLEYRANEYRWGSYVGGILWICERH